jgi:hypothetical protein
MADKKVCAQCSDVLKDQDAQRCPDIHPCDLRALEKARAEIKKLKASVNAWKEAWFNYRDLVGKILCKYQGMPENKSNERC